MKHVFNNGHYHVLELENPPEPAMMELLKKHNYHYMGLMTDDLAARIEEDKQKTERSLARMAVYDAEIKVRRAKNEERIAAIVKAGITPAQKADVAEAVLKWLTLPDYADNFLKGYATAMAFDFDNSDDLEVVYQDLRFQTKFEPCMVAVAYAVLWDRLQKAVPVDKDTIVPGSFTVTSDLVCIDPCYSEVKDGVVIKDVLPGTWFGKVMFDNDWGHRCYWLMACHEQYKDSVHIPQSKEEMVDWVYPGGCVSVDSGQAGIFDLSCWRNDSLIKELPDWCSGDDEEKEREPGEVWYGACCDKASSIYMGGVVPEGVMSRSGGGDAGYPAFVKRDAHGKAIAVMIAYKPVRGTEKEEDSE